MEHRHVSSIRAGDRADPIEIRVIRKWQPHWFKNEYCFLFVDRQGIAVEAYGQIQDKAYYDSKMKLHSCYRVADYLSGKQRNSLNVVPHQATVKLATGTTFTPIDDNGFPFHYFNFMPFHRLPDRLNIDFLLTDYIGRFDSIIYDKSTSKGRRLLKLLLEDENENYIAVAVWEEVANTLHMETLTQEPFPCIMAFTALKPKDTDYLIERLNEKYKGVSAIERNKFTIVQLLQKDPEQNSERKFTCLATIVDFVKGKPWFYKGCARCSKKLDQKEKAWVCGNHPKEEQHNLIYCINAIIADDTGTTTVTLFDMPSISLLQLECAQMILKHGSDPDTIPTPIQAIKGATKLFELQFNSRSQKGSKRFVVNRVLEAITTLEETPATSKTTATSTQTQSSTTQQLALADKQATLNSSGSQKEAITTPSPKQKAISPNTPAAAPPPCKRHLLSLSEEVASKKSKGGPSGNPP